MIETIKLVKQWHDDRLIINNGNTQTQFIKLVEEVAELGKAINRRDLPEAIDAIGDSVVVLISIATMLDLEIEECLDAAFSKSPKLEPTKALFAVMEIKDRTGHLNANGDFIKDVT